MNKFMLRVDEISTFVGKAASWLIILLMLMVCTDVFRRYALNSPSAWIGELSVMAYGTLFMMGGAYTLSQDGHVRGDFLYGNFKPRTQASIDLVLYIAFFLPGIAALTWSGWTYFQDSVAIHEQTFNADPLPVYPFKFMIPFAGALVLMQGISEIIRCVVCIKTGAWTPRLKDAQESDVVAQQLEGSEFVDEESKRLAIEKSVGMKG
jgi:TRAP-type mannitol/chloroaromatic compound transport system permease small subunit